jgi:hypothetical protein
MAKKEAASRQVSRSLIYPIISEAYTKMNQKAQDIIASMDGTNMVQVMASEPSPTVAAALLVCEEALARHHRSARAKITSWKSRTTRGLLVDDFGSLAIQLLDRTIESYDSDTYPLVGLAGAVAAHRLELRGKLREYVTSSIVQLFHLQVNILEKNILHRFNAELLRKHDATAMEDKKNGAASVEKFFNDNAAAVRSAAFSFDTALEKLEVPLLGLTKSNASRDMKTKLNAALLSFPDSPSARLKGMKDIARVTSKQKQPTERRIDFGLDLVAMIRPDGFGNFQGFAGYQLGGNNMIIGVHNDADSPDVISQFGGLRPPFIRFQPKLKVDVEL